MTTPATRAATVYGVPLEADERVIYFHRSDPGWEKPFLIVLGILTLFAFIGFFILYAGISAKTTVYIVTTRRYMIVEGKAVSFIRHGDVKRATKEVKGKVLNWYHLRDGRGTTLSWQAQANPWSMQDRIDLFLADSDAIASAPDVPFEAGR